MEPTAFRSAVLPEFWAVHVKPSPLVRMVPPAPTATQVPALVKVMPYKWAEVGTLLAAVQVMASLLVTMAPLSPTAICQWLTEHLSFAW